MPQAKRKKPTKSKGRNPSVHAVIPPPADVRARYPVLADFSSFDWQGIPQRHAYGIYAMCLYANLPDYLEVGAESITEGGDDKDCDLCLIDRESGDAFIVQSYIADKWDKPTAPANKADDLLTALTWLLKQPVKKVPETIRRKAIELQDAIAAGDVKRVHLLFTHNCRESQQVKDALETVAASAHTLIGRTSISVAAHEIGLPMLQHLYNSLTKQIVVDDDVVFKVKGALEEKTDKWTALQTTIDGDSLHTLWKRYGDDLFSANIRGFLDMLKRATSVNRGILETVTSASKHFWAFNNGVTILTKDIAYKAAQGELRASGVSVINGAQTTGVLGNAPKELAAKCRVPCRIIKCSDSNVINEIIENNNTQNAIKAFDIRSNDSVQRRLHTEFSKVSISYLHRRQGAMRLPLGAIQAETLAPYLAAFHGKFQVAIRQRRTIFEDRSTYGEVFPDQVTAPHALLVRALGKAIDDFKIELFDKEGSGSLNEAEKIVYDFLQFSTAKLFITSAIGKLASQILGRPVPDLFGWKVAPDYFKQDWTPVTARWKIVVESLAPLFMGVIDGEAKDVVRSTDALDKMAKRARLQIQSLKNSYNSVFDPIRTISP